MNCIVCGSETKQGLMQWHASCRQCRYESANLAPSINDDGAHARLDEKDREVALKALRASNFNSILAHLAPLAGTDGGRLLEVGCAHGWFLEQAGARFDVLGIEPDQAVGNATAARGLPVRLGYFPDALAQDEGFDVIVFNDVIEHIPDIRAALAACRAHLRPDGLLVLNLPSSRGFFYRTAKLMARLGMAGPFERMWQKGLPSPHVHYFNEGNLSRLAGDFGFVMEECFELPSLSSKGLMERLRCVGKVHPFKLYAQYIAIRCLMPVTDFFPSDIVTCIYRKRAAH